MTKDITVVARLKAKAGQEEALRNELLALVPTTVLEKGCLTYQLHQSADDPAQFMFYENWSSKDDLDDHLQRPHLQAFFGKADQLLAEPPQLSLWHMIE